MSESNWQYVYASVIGSSHQSREEPCQDAALVRRIVTPQETFLVACCSDGAGSAYLAAEGAALACEAFIARAAARLRQHQHLHTLSREVVSGWIGGIAGELAELARRRHAGPRETACTLLAAIINAHEAMFLQIGDGAIVVSPPPEPPEAPEASQAQRPGEYEVVFWPQMGEYAGQTNFITDPNAQSAFVFQWLKRPVHRLAMFTDGLQMVCLNYARHAAHAPFFDPLFNTLQNAGDTESLKDPFREFLNSDGVNARTDDDRTLILAMRRDAGRIARLSDEDEQA